MNIKQTKELFEKQATRLHERCAKRKKERQNEKKETQFSGKIIIDPIFKKVCST